MDPGGSWFDFLSWFSSYVWYAQAARILTAILEEVREVGKRIFQLVILGCILGYSLQVEAIGPWGRQGGGPLGWHRSCLPLEALGLSEAQKQQVDELNGRYMVLFARMRQELFFKRLEVEALLRDPYSTEEAVKEKSVQLMDAQRALHEKMVEYQLRLRALLTAEQVSKWCTLMGTGMGRKRWGMP